MHFDERRRARRAEFDLHAGAMFDEAWGSLRELAQPFKFELDLLRDPGGRWAALLAEHPLPAPDLPLALLEDLAAPEGEARDRAERVLFEAASLHFATVLLTEHLLFAESSYGHDHALLLAGLIASAEWRLAEVSRDPRHVRQLSCAAWNEANAALFAQRSARAGRAAPYTPTEVEGLGRRWAPLRTVMICAAEHAGRREVLEPLMPLLDEAFALFQLGRELASISRDAARGYHSLPIARLVQALGGSPRSAEPADPERVLLSAVLTRTLPALAAEGARRTRALREALEALALPRLGELLGDLTRPFEAVTALYDAKEREESSEAVFVASHRPQLEQVRRGADGYLRADPMYREAWEVNRWDFLNVPSLTCTVFPTGLILEQRIGAGDDCRDEVDRLFARYETNRFHYYDQKSSLPPDCDTLGLMMRLARHAAHPERCLAALETPLGWLRANVEEDGSVPVFMTRGVDAGDGRRHAHVAGRTCAAVGAGLLLGLHELDPRRFAALIAPAAARLFESVVRHRGAAFWFYDALLGSKMVLDLARTLVGADLGAELADARRIAERCAVDLLRAYRGLGRHSSQDAALLWLATGHPSASDLRDPAWVEHLIRAQHHDGGWDAAPLYVIPNRGNVMNWYSSRTVTTAFAYHALCDYEQRRVPAEPR